ncbi:MAG: protease HtpX [Oligoflexus sp.]|jgi:heat shock protein HtpX
MGWFKRIALFALVNVAIMVMVSLILNLLGVGGYRTAQGLDHSALMVFCLVWGMVGSFISLLLSKKIAKWTMGVQIISPSAGGAEGDLVRTVHRLAQAAGLSKMPEVGIYAGQEINAFATGPTKNNSLVAVSEGLLRHMNRDEVEGVLGHEIAHIANGDMVTLTLIQGVVNAFVMYIARVAAYAVSQFMRGDEEEGQGMSHLAYVFTVFFFEMIFGLLGSMVVSAFSRYREYRADAGGARLAGRNKMVAALQKLQAGLQLQDAEGVASMAPFKISSKPSKFAALFSTHPPLSERIARLQKYVV